MQSGNVEVILVKCHHNSTCHNDGEYIVEYRSGSEADGKDTGVSVYYGSCEMHIESMRLGAYGMLYINDIKVTLKQDDWTSAAEVVE